MWKRQTCMHASLNSIPLSLWKKSSEWQDFTTIAVSAPFPVPAIEITSSLIGMAPASVAMHALRARKWRLTVRAKEEKIKKKKDCERRIGSHLVNLISISSWGSSLCIAFSAVYGSASIRFERNFTFLFTLSTNCLMHFSWFSSSIRHLDYTSI